MSEEAKTEQTEAKEAPAPDISRPYSGVHSSGDLNTETIAALQKASEELRAQEDARNERDKQYLGIAEEAAKEADKEPEAATEAKPEEAAPADTPADTTPGEQPGLSVSALDAMQRLVEGQQALEKQKESLKPDIELAQKIKGLKNKYGTDRLGTIKEILELTTGLRGGDELQSAFDEYTLQVLGVEPSSESKAQSDTRRLRFEVEALKKEQAEAEKKRQEQAEASQRDSQARDDMNFIAQELGKMGDSFPFLAALQKAKPPGEQEAAALVYRHWLNAKEQGQDITLEKALKAEEDRIRATLEPFRDLLGPKKDGDSANQVRPPSDGPQTISSSMTSAPAATPNPEPGYIEDSEASRDRSIAMLQAMNRQRSQNGVN